MKKIFTCVSLITILMICLSSCFYPIIKMVSHEDKNIENMPDSFLVTFPLVIDDMNYFKVPCAINGGTPIQLIVDTKATSLMREEDLIKNKAKYWGRLPFSSENAYKEKEPTRLYVFDHCSIQGLSIGTPLFNQISKNNLIHDKVKDGVIGSNILKLRYWKFSIDDQEVTLFSKKDTNRIASEIKGYTLIPHGIDYDQIQLSLPSFSDVQDFTLDLGFSGEIEINNKLAKSLMKVIPFKTIETLQSNQRKMIKHLFVNQTITWNGVTIHNCQLVNIPAVDGSYIGAQFMRRFNFILAYGGRVKHKLQDHLYIQKVQGFESIQTESYISKFGFKFEQTNDITQIYAIEQGGIAQKQGLKLGDEIIAIDNGNFDITNSKQFISYSDAKECVIVKTKNRTYTLTAADEID